MDQKNSYLIPITILLAGAILSVAIYIVRIESIVSNPIVSNIQRVTPVSVTDHTIGNPQAPIQIVLYSDIDCEYCKTYLVSLEQLIKEYAPLGKVALVYRHFPQIETHQYSALHAQASECVASLGTPDLFFSFITALNESAPNNREFNPLDYDPIVSKLGVSVADFTACMNTDTYVKKVNADFNNGLDMGIQGTPFSLILIKDQNSIPITGAVPYETLKKIIDDAISKLSPA